MKGVEFSSELHDFISEDLSRLYPQLMAHTRMTLYDVAPQILGTFDQNLSAYATRKFARRGIQIKVRWLDATENSITADLYAWLNDDRPIGSYNEFFLSFLDWSSSTGSQEGPSSGER